MTAVICTYPLDVVRARLAFQVTGEHRYTGIANAFHTIYLKVVLVHSEKYEKGNSCSFYLLYKP